jgi:hypothetical protein
MKFTEEHAYGYSVQLWRQGDEVFGFFEASEGLAGDTPAGILDEVQFDPRSGALSFKAKLTIGVALLAAGQQEPSRRPVPCPGPELGAHLPLNLQRARSNR